MVVYENEFGEGKIMKLKTHLLLEFCQKNPLEATCTQAIKFWSLSKREKKGTPKLQNSVYKSSIMLPSVPDAKLQLLTACKQSRFL